MLSLDNISKSFGARKILADVSWSMADDGRVGLVGLNGAGKSTLLKIIGGVTTPDSGRISLPQRARVAYLHQESPDMGGRSVLNETLSALTRLQELDLRRHELTKLLAEQGLAPSVLIHRGHTWYVVETLEYLTSSAKLVYLGSCRGLMNAYSVIALSNRAQMIATSGMIRPTGDRKAE